MDEETTARGTRRTARGADEPEAAALLRAYASTHAGAVLAEAGPPTDSDSDDDEPAAAGPKPRAKAKTRAIAERKSAKKGG